MPKSKPFKIIIDTNLWISFIISNKLNLLDSIVGSGRSRLIFSTELIEEINATVKKPKLKKYFQTGSVEEMFSAFESFIDLIEVKTTISKCRDPKDNFLLSLAKDGKADYLITGDNDLLELIKIGKTTILTFSKFMEEMKK